jgi:PAS domain S-box-containing protein
MSFRKSEQPLNSEEAFGRIPQPTTGSAAVCSFDLKGAFTGCNAGFTQLFSYTANDLRGRKLATILEEPGSNSRHTRPETQEELLKAILEQDELSGVLVVVAKSGAHIPVRFTGTLLRDTGNNAGGIVAVMSPLEAPVSTRSTEQTGQRRFPGRTSRVIDGNEFVLASPVMHEFLAVERVASHTETVLVTGETGTGKELIARTIHQSSHRSNRPWIDINCAALPENLVESELFGYEKGAFSGAESSKPGLFELADKGTLFLDEIGELQLHTQVKLLRILDNQPFYRLGGHRKIRVDVRVVAATNQDLESAVQNGRFRSDLFHRLRQFQLCVPPLRERPEDIVALAEHFLRLKSPTKHFSPQAISALLSHSWPGNIRELRNLVAKLAMESSEAEIDILKISAALSGEPAAMRQSASMPVGNLDSMEEHMIIKALERTGGHRTLAAEQLGISRRTLSRKLKEYNISFAPGEGTAPLGFISTEQQKFFRARVETPVTIKNSRGESIQARAVNLSTGGMGLDGFTEPLRFSGLLDLEFVLPDTDVRFQAKARMMWVGEDGRVGLRFTVIEPVLFEQLQSWTNRKMKEEGWEFPS